MEKVHGIDHAMACKTALMKCETIQVEVELSLSTSSFSVLFFSSFSFCIEKISQICSSNLQRLQSYLSLFVLTLRLQKFLCQKAKRAKSKGFMIFFYSRVHGSSRTIYYRICQHVVNLFPTATQVLEKNSTCFIDYKKVFRKIMEMIV